MPDNKNNIAGETEKSELVIVRSRSVDITYQIPHQIKKTIVTVELWYAQTSGEWKFYGFDQDLTSPVRFDSPCEGTYRFLVVVVDKWGRRSCGEVNTREGSAQNIVIPRDVKEHLKVFIDSTLPQIFMQCSEVSNQGQRAINIRWIGFDSHLAEFPVNFSWTVTDDLHKSPESLDWQEIPAPQPADGRYVWRLPAKIPGSVRLKAAIVDKAGNQDVQYSKIFYPCDITGVIFPVVTAETGEKTQKTAKARGQDTGIKPVARTSLARIPQKTKNVELGDPGLSKSNVDHKAVIPPVPVQVKNKGLDDDSLTVERTLTAGRDFQRGCFHSEREEWQQARLAFQKALEVNPKMQSARLELAFACFEMRDFDQAIVHFEHYLAANPSHQTALIGLARAQKALNQGAQISKTLEKLSKIDKESMRNILLQGQGETEIVMPDGSVEVVRDDFNGVSRKSSRK